MIHVKGFPRSGNHYIAKLINVNFDDNQNYFKHLKDVHCILKDHDVKDSEDKFIHVYRNFDDVAKSIFVLRNRFGLKADSKGKMLSSWLADLYSPNLPVEVYRNEELFKNATTIFKDVNKSLKSYWGFFVSSHLRLSHFDNFLNIKYEELLGRFDFTMQKIGYFLDIDKKEFTNIKDKIGWYIK